MSEHVREVVSVETASRSYDVVVGCDLLDGLGRRAREATGADTAMVVTDAHVAPLYLERTMSSLEKEGLSPASVTVSAGEQNKTLETYGLILDAMAKAGLSRDSVVVALGGGVVGDMAGFAAATYMRGIQVVQVPTTLLSMVDSSVGGKTAIDLTVGKNLVGAFLQPALVIADVDCLRTLLPEVFVDGMGEVVKHGVLSDKSLFELLMSRPLLLNESSDYLAEIVARNVRIKRDVVGMDETERGVRQTLNLGHTMGHAIEAASGYSLGHGHCVAAGLCCMARATEALGWTQPGTATRIETCVAAQGLPTDTSIDHESLMLHATRDKKRHGSGLNVVVPESIGVARIQRVSFDEFSHMLDLGCGKGA